MACVARLQYMARKMDIFLDPSPCRTIVRHDLMRAGVCVAAAAALINTDASLQALTYLTGN